MPGPSHGQLFQNPGLPTPPQAYPTGPSAKDGPSGRGFPLTPKGVGHSAGRGFLIQPTGPSGQSPVGQASFPKPTELQTKNGDIISTKNPFGRGRPHPEVESRSAGRSSLLQPSSDSEGSPGSSGQPLIRQAISATTAQNHEMQSRNGDIVAANGPFGRGFPQSLKVEGQSAGRSLFTRPLNRSGASTTLPRQSPIREPSFATSNGLQSRNGDTTPDLLGRGFPLFRKVEGQSVGRGSLFQPFNRSGVPTGSSNCSANDEASGVKHKEPSRNSDIASSNDRPSGTGFGVQTFGRGSIFLQRSLPNKSQHGHGTGAPDITSPVLRSVLPSSEVSTGTRQAGTSIQHSSCTGSDLPSSTAQLPLETETPPVVMTGKAGDPITVHTNYIRLNTDPDKGIFQYDVKFDPDIDSRRLRFNLMSQITSVVGDTRTFDGAILYLPVRLPDLVTIVKAFTPNDQKEVEIKITFIKSLYMGHPHSVHLYNILFRRVMNILGLALHGQHFFDPKGVNRIPEHKLEVWPGFVTSIQNFEGGVMLCCDASHRVLRTQTVHEMWENMISSNPNNSRQQDDFIEMIAGQRVLTKYNNKIYRVDDIDFSSTPKATFTKKGTEVSYIDYYKAQYDVDIIDTSQPLLKSKVKSVIRGEEQSHMVDLIPELCYITGITDEMRKDFKIMKSIAHTTQVGPQQRHEAMRRFLKNISDNTEAKALFENWGLALAEDSEPLPARTLNCEDVYFGGGKICSGSFQVDWTRGASSNPVLDTVEFSSWFVVSIQRDQKTVNEFISMVQLVSKKLGITVTDPKMLAIGNDNITSYMQALQEIKRQPQVSIIVIILPVARADKYNAIKKFCCRELPVPSQVIITRTIRNPEKLRSVTTKIVLQMNCKLGGTLWTVKIPLKQTMIVGLDVFHGANKPSVGAMVCSMNSALTRWYSKTYKTGVGIELQDGLESMFFQCLRYYSKVNGALPEQIAMYRDGIGDGQVKMVIEHEIPQMVNSCRQAIPGYEPKFLVVIVQKRISARFYADDSKGLRNPLPGSVLDHTVTRRDVFDFFLVSQNVRVGTVSPTHYIVAHNTTSMDPDKIQRLTYKMTHLYYNWCGTVRVPAPCQYAHKLAYLVGESIDKEADECLADKLYYL